MVNVNDAYSSTSNWLRTEDLRGHEAKVVISGAKMEDIGSDHKLVVYFKGKDKGLALNKTNARSIAAIHGDETDGWLGKEIIMFPTMVDYQGKMVPAIRIRSVSSDLDDEIPF